MRLTSEATPFCLRDELATRRRIVQAFSSPELLVPLEKEAMGRKWSGQWFFQGFGGSVENLREIHGNVH